MFHEPGFVELQILRHGPPHNQLLSPLTEYFALCGDHTNTTLRIDLEHDELETRLRALRYDDSEQTRVAQLRSLARLGSNMLAAVPGLIADIASNHAEDRPFVHLSIASRASELALFPFELALAPDGFPGAGQALCMQKQLPVCMTRRSRNVRNDTFPWDRPVKILLVASDAGGDIPIMQHYALLRKLVEPWVGTQKTDARAEIKRKLNKVLRLLTDADVDRIADVLRDEVRATGTPFTHIHVLAHGCMLSGKDTRYAVALHDRTGASRPDAVDGKRLAETLGCLPDYPSSSNRYRGPAVVTLATCESADQGDVIAPGASLAFDLHDSGIPLVIGSQFPLSAEGSIIMTEALYRGLLTGGDPRSTIWETRRALQANLTERCKTRCAKDAKDQRAAHDWASMTVYAALPRDMDLLTHRRRQLRRRMDVRLHNSQIQGFNPKNREEWWQRFLENSSKAGEEVKDFRAWAMAPENAERTARVSNVGILASAEKLLGLWYFRAAMEPSETIATGLAADSAVYWSQGEQWLRDARSDYKDIFDLSREDTWALVQFLALEFALRGNYDDEDWHLAHILSKREQRDSEDKRQIWALAALLELEFLRWMKAEFDGKPIGDVSKAQQTATEIQSLSNRHTIEEVASATRQFRRYVDDIADLSRINRIAHSPSQSPAPVEDLRSYSEIRSIVMSF